MLRKLLKYEFKSTARILLPLYGALLGFAIINKFFIGFDNQNNNMGVFEGIPMMISMVGYVGTMVAVVVVTFFIIIQRFYKNLLGDEGYLMNTLPVSLSQNIISKVLVSVVWNIISAIVAILSIIIMAYKPGVFEGAFIENGGFLGFIRDGYEAIGVNICIIPMEIIVLMLLGVIQTTLMIYASISLGHLANKRKILSSFGAYIVLTMAMNTIVGIISGVTTISANDFTITTLHVILVSAIIVEFIFSAIYFAICNYVLKNKLNLE